MELDLRVIIGHNLTLKEIIEFSYPLNRNTELKELLKYYICLRIFWRRIEFIVKKIYPKASDFYEAFCF